MAHFRFRRDVIGDTGFQAYRNTGSRIVKAIWHCLHTGQVWRTKSVAPTWSAISASTPCHI